MRRQRQRASCRLRNEAVGEGGSSRLDRGKPALFSGLIDVVCMFSIGDRGSSNVTPPYWRDALDGPRASKRLVWKCATQGRSRRGWRCSPIRVKLLSWSPVIRSPRRGRARRASSASRLSGSSARPPLRRTVEVRRWPPRTAGGRRVLGGGDSVIRSTTALADEEGCHRVRRAAQRRYGCRAGAGGLAVVMGRVAARGGKGNPHPWYPGMEGGHVLADTILGGEKAEPPPGRSPIPSSVTTAVLDLMGVGRRRRRASWSGRRRPGALAADPYGSGSPTASERVVLAFAPTSTGGDRRAWVVSRRWWSISLGCHIHRAEHRKAERCAVTRMESHEKGARTQYLGGRRGELERWYRDRDAHDRELIPSRAAPVAVAVRHRLPRSHRPPVNTCVDLAAEVEGLVVGVLVDFAGLDGSIRVFLDRMSLVKQGHAHKLAVAVANCRRGALVRPSTEPNSTHHRTMPVVRSTGT